MNSELENQLSNLRDVLSKSQKVSDLKVCNKCGQPSEGWGFVRDQLEKVLEGFKVASVAPKSLESPTNHATVVGGYNAIRSFLDMLDSWEKAGPKATERIHQLESDNQEEIDRLGL